MGTLAYVIIGLLSAAGYAAAASVCGVVGLESTCADGYTPVYSGYPSGPDIACIKLDKESGPMTYGQAKSRCENDPLVAEIVGGGFLAEPKGYLHQAIYELIMCEDRGTEAFWIGGKDADHEDYWEWESGDAMHMGTPHWMPCDPSQPLITDTNANHACMWEPDFYFFSCTEGIKILAMCQTGPK